MQYQEFKEWLENNSNSKHIFLTKWKDYQISKNSKRTGKTKKWDDDKIIRTGEEEWKKIVANTYQKLKSHLGISKYNGYQEWIDFIEKNEILESFDNSILEIELE